MRIGVFFGIAVQNGDGSLKPLLKLVFEEGRKLLYNTILS